LANKQRPSASQKCVDFETEVWKTNQDENVTRLAMALRAAHAQCYGCL
jgi:hypothetical protein